MGMRVRGVAAAILAVALPATARADTFSLSGTIRWTDGGGGLHHVRLSNRVELWDYDQTGGGGDELFDLGVTDFTGGYEFLDVENDDDQGTFDPYVTVFADGPAHFVSSDGTAATTYTYSSTPILDIGNGSQTSNVAIPNAVASQWAFSVSDAVATGTFFATDVRGAPPPVAVRFPFASSFYSPASARISLTAGDRWDWDVILHEYAHHLQVVDGLANNPGGNHTLGVSNIGTNGHNKDEGVRLAWAEGHATYLSIAAQQVAQAHGYLPFGVPNTNDTFYTDTIDAAIHVDLEGNAGSAVAGEGDETSVFRILYDIADGKNEAHDQIAVGHDYLYDVILESGADQLDHLWDYFYENTQDLLLDAGTPDDEARALLGDIFEEYNVSPDPVGAAIDAVFNKNHAAPTFDWAPGNNLDNDTFTLFFFTANFTSRVFAEGIAVPGNVLTYTLTQAEWDVLKAQPDGLYRWVVAGADTNEFTTGAYWSGAERFWLVPEPGGWALAASAGILLGAVRRRESRSRGRS